MQEFNIFNYYQKMLDHDIILAFKGTISQEILVDLAEMIKGKLSGESVTSIVTKKVFAVFIELAQNINLYSADRVIINNSVTKVGTGIIVLIDDTDFYKITSGNMIENIKVPKIRERCNYINHLDKEGLKQFYKEQLKRPRCEFRQGGGIGLIDIARKCESSLDYIINPIDNYHSFFVLSVKIQKEGKSAESKNT